MSHKPVALWAVPRSISTAFERVFVERGDFKVFHEPFSASYYYSPERRSDRFTDVEPKEEHCFAEVTNRLLAPSAKPVFFKDMAYYVSGSMTPEFVERFRNTFIIREPRAVLASFSKLWPNFTFEEAGFEELHRLFEYTVELGQEPVVVDAADLSEDPETIVAAYCERIGVPFIPDALTWEPREVPEWEMWDEWHEDAQKSTGIGKLSREEVELSDELEEIARRCLPYYEAMHAKRIRV
ncbi:MAG: Similarity [uncultured Rubrobacteraceae bacterium]|uniref:Similarity n=1 Tax=uncultured Rubrobacteraceae bacterium TaxID=349277 RepID=A0A6J4PTP9_9ACTN|nr:MAG: Similarity [uncultured Rubrobacteraceae bacterium]